MRHFPLLRVKEKWMGIVWHFKPLVLAFQIDAGWASLVPGLTSIHLVFQSNSCTALVWQVSSLLHTYSSSWGSYQIWSQEVRIEGLNTGVLNHFSKLNFLLSFFFFIRLHSVLFLFLSAYIFYLYVFVRSVIFAAASFVCPLPTTFCVCVFFVCCFYLFICLLAFLFVLVLFWLLFPLCI